jgi:DNA polymerase I
MPIPQTCYNGVKVVTGPDLPNVERLDNGVLPMLWEFHRNGITIDRGKFAELSVRLHAKLAELSAEINALIGRDLNYNSGDQLAPLLFNELGLTLPGGKRPMMTKSGGREAVDDEVLSMLRKAHPVVPLLTEARATDKLLGTYVDKLPQLADGNDRIHTRFKHTTAETGRLASEDPNLQNCPARTEDGRAVRNAFIAGRDPHNPSRRLRLVSHDLSQIEMVSAAELGNDKVMLDLIGSGADIHTRTACECFHESTDIYIPLAQKAVDEEMGKPVTWLEGEKARWKAFKSNKRMPAKQVGFGLLFGQTPEGAQSNIVAMGGPWLELAEVEDIIHGWFALYSGIHSFMEMCYFNARNHGMVWDIWGRIRRIPQALSTLRRVQNEGFRAAGNMPIQATAQGIIKLAMAEIMDCVIRFYQAQPGITCRPLLQIHDEVISEMSPEIVDEYGMWVQYIMQNVVRFSVPIRASWSQAECWGDLK